jgi:endonuclease/exonuclease/phosphatase (EEP) superfamily protein YafD
MGRRSVAVWGLRALVALLALWAGFRLLGLERGYPLVALVALTPYIAAIGVLVLSAAVYVRRWAEALAAAVAVALLAVAVLPRAVPGQSTGPIDEGVPLDVLTVNLHVGEADAAAVAELALRGEVDLLCAQELTAAAAERLRGAGMDELLPEQELSPAEGSSGAGIYSRYPLRPLADVPEGISRMLRARVGVPGAGAVEVVDVHPFPPTEDNASRWRRGLEALPRADGEGPILVLAGDFNAGFDHAEFRDLVGSGYVDAAAARGRGLATTWPADGAWPPPVAIDHVLTDERAHVADADVLEAPDSDHRPVLARLVLPPRERG